jgi:SAM-dependent methyltransferase
MSMDHGSQEEASGSVSALVPPLEDNGVLTTWIAEVTGQPIALVRERLYQEQLRWGHNVNGEIRRLGIKSNEWSQELIQFYEQTDSFLYESIVWNRNPRKLAMRRWIGEVLAAAPDAPRKILVYGDGPGFESAYLARCGFDVTYFEVSQLSCKFARRVFELASCPVRMVVDPADLGVKQFDVVVCLDVLEHVPAPEETVAEFATYLRPQGRLIVHAPFYLTAGGYATHLNGNRRRYSGRINSLYGRHGFALEDGRLFWDPLVLRKVGATSSQLHRRWLQKCLMRMTGAALWGGRFWSRPYVMIADLMTTPDERWLEGLQP